MFWQPILNLSNFYNQFVNAASGAERIFEIMDRRPVVTSREGAQKLEAIEGRVEFKRVTFGYDEEAMVLRDVDFSVASGETIALVGPTGAGKSTVVNLISRFYDIQDGQILIDGKDIRELDLASLRTQMGIMTQDNYIFSGTIRENITFGLDREASDAEVEAAAEVPVVAVDTQVATLLKTITVMLKRLLMMRKTNRRQHQPVVAVASVWL